MFDFNHVFFFFGPMHAVCSSAEVNSEEVPVTESKQKLCLKSLLVGAAMFSLSHKLCAEKIEFLGLAMLF